MSASIATMEGNNWTNIDNITDSNGSEYIRSTFNITYQNNTLTLLTYFYEFMSVYNSTYNNKTTLDEVNTSAKINISQINNFTYWNAISTNYTSGHGNGTLITSKTGFDYKRNTSFITDSMWNSAGVYQAIGVSEMPLENNSTIGGYVYNISQSNTYGVTLQRAGSILHTTQSRNGSLINTSTMTQDGNGWKFDWGTYNSVLGRRENRIAIETGIAPDLGMPTGLNMYGNHITDSPDISMIWTTGVTSGGNISFDTITGNITISSGTVAIRDANSEFSDLNEHIFYGRNFTIAPRDIKYIYLKYNGTGHPFLNSTSNFGDIDGRTAVHLYQVQQESATEIHYVDARAQNVGMGLKLRRMLYDTQRFAHGGGAMLGNPSGLNVSITSGKFYYGLNSINTIARNTASGDTIEVYRRIANLSYVDYNDYKINNTYYDNNGVITTLTNNKYRVDWIYLELSSDQVSDGEFSMVLGQNQYSTIADAVVATPPSSLPNSITNLGVLIGRTITQKSATNISQTDSAFTQTFVPSVATNHNDLSNLQGGTSNEYYHLTSAEYSGLVTKTTSGNITLTSTPSCITMKSQDGTNYMLQIANGGTTQVTAGVCN